MNTTHCIGFYPSISSSMNCMIAQAKIFDYMQLDTALYDGWLYSEGFIRPIDILEAFDNLFYGIEDRFYAKTEKEKNVISFREVYENSDLLAEQASKCCFSILCGFLTGKRFAMLKDSDELKDGESLIHYYQTQDELDLTANFTPENLSNKYEIEDKTLVRLIVWSAIYNCTAVLKFLLELGYMTSDLLISAVDEFNAINHQDAAAVLTKFMQDNQDVLGA